MLLGLRVEVTSLLLERKAQRVHGGTARFCSCNAAHCASCLGKEEEPRTGRDSRPALPFIAPQCLWNRQGAHKPGAPRGRPFRLASAEILVEIRSGCWWGVA